MKQEYKGAVYGDHKMVVMTGRRPTVSQDAVSLKGAVCKMFRIYV